MSHKIFVLDDDADLVRLISDSLTEEGYQVYSETDPIRGLEMIKRNMPDLVLLDIRMKRRNGLDICRELKSDEKTQHIFIVMLSAKTDSSDVVVGLEIGAEDYIRKPVQPAEILARVKTVLKRKHQAVEPEMRKIGPLALDHLKYSANINDEIIHLRPKEFELLWYLSGREGQVVTRQAISEYVWGHEHTPTSKTIESHVYELRLKLGSHNHWIKALKGVGYRFEIEP